MEEETYNIRKTYTIPTTIVKRYEAYLKATPKRERFNASAIVSDALDKKLKEVGF